MSTVGWIIFGVICVLMICVATMAILKKNSKPVAKLIAVILAAAVCVGGYFGAKHFFPLPAAEPEIEEEATEEVISEESVEEATSGD